MSPKSGGYSLLIGAAAALGVLITAAAGPAGAATLQTLYSFCSLANCADGSNPAGGVTLDAMGDLYGATQFGQGTSGLGMTFELIPNQKKHTWQDHILYRFCQKVNCKDGAQPLAPPILVNGQLYGTTEGALGSATDLSGVVYQLIGSGKRRHEFVLHHFSCGGYCSQAGGPHASVIADDAGNLYGTTTSSANGMAEGTIFELIPNADRSKWSGKILYDFPCSQNGCLNGVDPFAGVTRDKAGNLYGTASSGGSGQGGVAFQSFRDTSGNWQERVLYNFCTQSKCVDGYNPQGGLLLHGARTIYGTTYLGGTSQVSPSPGVAFALHRNGDKNTWVESVLYNFCSFYSNSDCEDGASPISTLIEDVSGNLYGTTCGGGLYNRGVIFKLTPASQGLLWKETVL